MVWDSRDSFSTSELRRRGSLLLQILDLVGDRVLTKFSPSSLKSLNTRGLILLGLIASAQKMPGNPSCTVYIGNLDEKVSEKVLYEIMIQAGRVVDLHIPRDKDTNRSKGYAFAEYGTEEVAEYAVRLFSGLVSLFNRTLKFAISGQDKTSQNLGMHASFSLNSYKNKLEADHLNKFDKFQEPTNLSPPCRFSPYSQLSTPSYPKASPGLVSNGPRSVHRSTSFDYSRRVFGTTMDNTSRYEAHSSRVVYDSRQPVTYPSY